MAKKVMKKLSKKKFTIPKEKNVERMLVENFVSLQKVMTNLSVRFDELSNQISKLLELFEVSANALAKKDINFTKPMDEKKIMDKLERIVDQNKTIARGLTLIHEKGGVEISEKPMSPPVPGAPKRMFPPGTPKEEYQKSPFSKGF